MLRSQAQAVYSPNNIGHFGLALPRYAHFTSPIRRYADLVVHRALTAPAGRTPMAGEALAATAEHISITERRAAAAERAALDRYRATLLAAAIGTVYEARITGIAPFGFFISLPESGADGLVPVSTLPSDYYDHDARRHRLVGRRSGQEFALGDAVTRAPRRGGPGRWPAHVPARGRGRGFGPAPHGRRPAASRAAPPPLKRAAAPHATPGRLSRWQRIIHK